MNFRNMPFEQAILSKLGLNKLLEENKSKYSQDHKKQLKIALLGRSGSGKSTLINSLVGSQVTSVGNYEPMTKKIEFHNLKFGDAQFCLIDTPGIGDNENEIEEEYFNSLTCELEQLDSMLFVSRLSDTRVSGDEKRAIKLISEKLGSRVWERSLIVFTCSDYIEPSQAAAVLEKRTELLRQVIANYADPLVADKVSSVAVNNKDTTVIFFTSHSFDETEQLIGDDKESSETAISTLLNSLTAKDIQTRSQAALSLGKLGIEDAVPALSHALITDQSPEVRRSAAKALGMIGSADSEAKGS